MYEINEYSIGTREILDEISNSSAMKIVGGHTISAVNRFGFRKYMDYVSTGGGALINYLSGDSIPVTDAVKVSRSFFEKGIVDYILYGGVAANLFCLHQEKT